MHAIRVARAYTGRERIIKFEGMYHGFNDYTLWSTYTPTEAYGNPANPISIPSSSGIPRQLSELVTTLPFNYPDGLEKILRSIGRPGGCHHCGALHGELRSNPSTEQFPSCHSKAM